MPEDITPSATNTPAVNVAPTPALAATNALPDTPAVDGNNEQLSLEEARKLRKEAATLRARLKTYDDAEAQRQQEALSDVQKATKRAEELEQRYQQEHKQHINALVKLAASAKGIIDPDLAALAIEASLEFGDDGKPSNLDTLLEDLVKNKPYLVKPAEAQTTPAQTQQRPPATPAMNPGRSQIVQPGAAPQGRRATLYDQGLWKK